MAVFNGMFPVLPGKEDAGRAFAKEVAGARLKDFEAQQARADITREVWSLQETPMGSFVLVYFEGNVEKAFADIATSDSDFAKWFRAQVKENNGVDLAAPDGSPPPEVLLDWQS
jgi:hypothetical protein